MNLLSIISLSLYFFGTAQAPKNLTSFQYIHIPKCGTSFIITLRQYLDSCKVKNFTCTGVLGGGKSKFATKNKKDELFFNSKITSVEETCGDELIACEWKLYHAKMRWEFKKSNLVTMIREPRERLFSHVRMLFEWKKYYKRRGGTLSGLLNDKFALEQIINDPWKFDTNTHVKSLVNLQTDRLLIDNNLLGYRAFMEMQQFKFWGITDYWGLSICLFHCELGGEINLAIECQNVRPNPSEDNIVNFNLSIFDKYVKEDMKLYELAKPVFFKRVVACSCFDLCDIKKSWLQPYTRPANWQKLKSIK